MKYKVTKKECLKKIHGVCEGCGGELVPIETEDNSGNPTFWVGCKKCSCFRHGIDRRYFEIARKLVVDNEVIPYPHLKRSLYEKNKEDFEYYLHSQVSRLSDSILLIHKMLKEKFSEQA